MPVMDEFKEERDEIKKMGFKARLSYFWDYYKWHVIGGVIAVVAIVSLVSNFLNRKDTAFYAIFMNIPDGIGSADYKKGFAEFADIDLKEYNVYFDTDALYNVNVMDNATIATSQKLLVYASAGDLDVLLADIQGLDRYAYNDSMMDLRQFLTPEEYEKYEPYFYYMDHALVENLDFNENITEYPENPRDPSNMEKPIPVAIYLEQCPGLKASYPVNAPHYFSVFVNSSHLDYAHDFLKYVWEH